MDKLLIGRGGLSALLAFSLPITASLTAAPALAEDMTAQPLPATMAARLGKATMVKIAKAGDRLVAVGDYGVIQISDDSGASWRQVEGVPVSRMLTSVMFINDSTGWAIGYDKTILRTDDAGQTWKLQHFSADPGWPLYDIFFLDDKRGFVVGERGTFMSTQDGGESWAEVETDIAGLGMHLNDIIQLKSGCLFMVGEKGVLATSIDDGKSWNLIQTPYVGSFFGAMPYGETGAIVYGLRGNVYVTESVHSLVFEDLDEWDEYGRETVTDEAALAEMGWTHLKNDQVDSFFGGDQLSNGEAILVGVNGRVMKTNLSRKRMDEIETPLDLQLGDLVVAGGNLVAVGVGGIKRVPY